MTSADFKLRFRRIALVGPLVECKAKDHLNAVKEFLYTLVFSLSPILIALIVDYWTKDTFAPVASILSNISNGELLLYSTSLLSPVFYTVMNDRGEKRTFPSKNSHMTVYIFIMGLSAIAFALQRAGVYMRTEPLTQTSYALFLLSLVLLYLVIVYNSSSSFINPATEMRDQEDGFSESVRKHRGVQ